MIVGKRLERAKAPFLLFLASAVVYVASLGPQRLAPSPDNHFVHLAASFMHGQLGVVGNEPPGTNDWACYDTEEQGPCPPGRYSFPGADHDRYHWYVSFPPFPAIVIAPVVAVMGLHTPDRLFWAICAAIGPALLYALFRRLRETGRSERTPREDVLLTFLFAFGTVYFSTAVQGTVWFAAHTVAVPLIVVYVMASLDAKQPLLAGSMLALAFMTRATTLFLAPLFLLELLSVARKPGKSVREADPNALVWSRLARYVRETDLRELVRPLAMFAAPILAIGLFAMWMNDARFGDPFEFGHTFLQIRWRPRIEKWGLFNYHYLAKNLSVFLAGLPWLSAEPPHVKISRHGLALWFTTPALLLVLWPKKPMTRTMIGLAIAAGTVAVLNLMYQNSGWVQFAYRFALDYLVLLFALLAMGGRRFGPVFYLAMIFAIAVNAFGAFTFDRAGVFYDGDSTQNVLFQPD